MSFLVAALDGVADAAGSLAGIGSALGEATTAAAIPTTSLEAAAADDVSIAISQTFGACGEQFQALSAQAAALHENFVAERANAQQGLLNAVNVPTGANTAFAEAIGGPGFSLRRNRLRRR